MNKSKINKYKINNNNKTNTKHEFNVKYERYKQDISKDTLIAYMYQGSPHLQKIGRLDFSLREHEGEVKA
jgi:site-specific DNA-adenine methylase